jgi:glycosyltransferase involved in cell wall biosynthesis
MPKLLESSAVFVGCARNCAAHLAAVFQNIERLASVYAKTAFIFVENDSHDGTKEKLSQWAADRPNSTLLHLDGLVASEPSRTARLATARNRYIDEMASGPYAHFSDLIVMDLDDVNAGQIDLEAFVAAVEFLHADDQTVGVFANSKPVYFDIWALRHPQWCPNDCWAEVRAARDMAPAAALDRFVYARQIAIDPGRPPIEVDSAFGGLAIYRLAGVLAHRHRGTTSVGTEVCEHVSLNLALRRSGRLFIFPGLQNSTPPEHVRNSGLPGSRRFGDRPGIVVWMPVFNEARHLEAAIASVLSQSHDDFRLVISDNFSTDASAGIINAATLKDTRVSKTSPPRHLVSLEHNRYIQNEILDPSREKYSIFIGGHDLWHVDLLKRLLDRAEQEPHGAITYTDSYEIDDRGQVTKQYFGFVHAKEIMRPFIPQHVLLGLTHNIVWGGLWTEAIRKKVRMRHACSAIDHLMVAEAALHGSIVYQPGSAVFLRAANYSGHKDYARKHIPESIRELPILDFLNQLEWCDFLIDQAVQATHLDAEQPKSMLKASLISTYILRYAETLTGFEGGPQTFFANPLVQSVVASSQFTAAKVRELIRSK